MFPPWCQQSFRPNLSGHATDRRLWVRSVNAHNDVVTLQRRIDHLVRAANRIRAHLPDLHSAAWEHPNTSHEKVRETKTDYVPAVADMAPPGRALWQRVERDLEHAETLLVALERSVTGLFMVTAAVEPSRGSLISRAEFDQLRANQRRRPDTPARLVDQPQHPGAKR